MCIYLTLLNCTCKNGQDGDFPGGSVVKNRLAMLGMRVPSLGEELRFHMPQSN